MKPQTAAQDYDIQEEIQQSMKLPWTPRPYSRTNAENHPSHRPGYDRRSQGILKRMRRHLYHAQDSIGLFLWAIVGLLVAVMAWGTFIGFERWIK
jgi:hypothetical protein